MFEQSNETYQSARVASFYIENILEGQGNGAKQRLVHGLINTATGIEEAAFIKANTEYRLNFFPEMTVDESETLAHVVLKEHRRRRALRYSGPTGPSDRV